MKFKVYFVKEEYRKMYRIDAPNAETAEYYTRGHFGNDIEIVKTEAEIPNNFDIFDILGIRK